MYKQFETKMKPSHQFRKPTVDWRRQLARGTFLLDLYALISKNFFDFIKTLTFAGMFLRVHKRANTLTNLESQISTTAKTRKNR